MIKTATQIPTKIIIIFLLKFSFLIIALFVVVANVAENVLFDKTNEVFQLEKVSPYRYVNFLFSY